MKVKNKAKNYKNQEELIKTKSYEINSFNNLSNIQFNPEELDILSKEIKEEHIATSLVDNNNPLNIQLSNEEIQILLNEMNNNDSQEKGVLFL